MHMGSPRDTLNPWSTNTASRKCCFWIARIVKSKNWYRATARLWTPNLERLNHSMTGEILSPSGFDKAGARCLWKNARCAISCPSTQPDGTHGSDLHPSSATLGRLTVAGLIGHICLGGNMWLCKHQGERRPHFFRLCIKPS